jgi:hypothetical protein
MNMCLRTGLLVVFFLLCPLIQYGQTTDFTGIRIFINPGHGGHDSDDRHIIATDFWESEGNLEKGLFLRDLLSDRNATVFMSRTTNFSSDDLPLSTIAAMANTANADIFLSIHSNGYDGTRNQPLVLFRGYDDQPVFPAAKEMAHILWNKLFEKGNCWTHMFEWVKGDWTFYPEWGYQVGLGVLRTLTMPGVLSEGSFHDYIPESWRLRNTEYLHHESWAFLRALTEFENVSSEPTGIIAGTVRDKLTSPDYYFQPGTKDEAAPINDATVTLISGNISVTTDDLNNGFFMYDSLPPGDYELICSGIPDFLNDTVTVTVVAGKTTLVDFLPDFDTTIVPLITEFLPGTADSLPFNQDFTFVFNVPMDRNAVQAALQIDPAADLVCEWDAKGKVMTVRPETGFASKTSYQLRLTTGARSYWNVPLQSEFKYDFVTRSRTKLIIEQIFPSDLSTGVTLYPQVRVYFDALPDQASASGGIRVVNSQSDELSKLRESFTSSAGKGMYSFELAQPLALNSQYRIVLDAGVKDITGTSLGENTEVVFYTRKKAYESGTVIEAFDDISGFWDPEASGSTTGTDNPLTTFTASYDVLHSGSASGRLDYVFTDDNGGLCRVFDTRKPVIGSNTSQSFGMWVFGDLSNNILEYWFYSPGSVNQIVVADTIDWAGWDLITIPFSHIGGSGEWQYHSLVIRQQPSGAKSGTMFFDEAIVFTPTGTDDNLYQDALLDYYPNPLNTNGVVTFVPRYRSLAVLDIYSSDGRLTENLFTGAVDPEPHTVQWLPSASVAPGVYTLRLSLRTEGEVVWHHLARRWVVIR